MKKVKDLIWNSTRASSNFATWSLVDPSVRDAASLHFFWASIGDSIRAGLPPFSRLDDG